jgi:hypothetical protein
MIFWLNLPLAALAIVVMDRPLRLLQVERRQHRLDWLGAILIMASTVIFLLILTWGGARFAWVSEPIIGLFIVRCLARIPSAACLRTVAPDGPTSKPDRLSGSRSYVFRDGRLHWDVGLFADLL